MHRRNDVGVSEESGSTCYTPETRAANQEPLAAAVY
jgi:hypothetical protein